MERSKFHIEILTCLLIYVLAMSGTLRCNAQTSPNEPIPFDFTVLRGQLANGFTYYIRNNNSKGVELRLLVKAGHTCEDRDQLEVAHVLEHMGFRATTHFPNGVRQYLDQQGIKAKTNASTGENYTVYYLNLLENSPEQLKTCLKVLREWASEFVFIPGNIDTERQMVLAELTSGSSHYQQRMQEVNFKILGRQVYSPAHSNEILESVSSFSRDALIRFYKDWYRPDLQAAVIVGDVIPNDVQKQMVALFGDLKSPNNPRKLEHFTDAWAAELAGKTEIIRVTDAEIINPKLEFFMKKREAVPFGRPVTINDLHIGAIEELFNEMVKRRLGEYIECNSIFKALSIQMQTSPFVSLSRMDALHSVAEISSIKSIKPALQSLVVELERIRRYGFTEAELTNAKQVVSTSSREDTYSNHSIAGRLADHFVFGSAAPDPYVERKLVDSLVSQITVDGFNQTIKGWVDFDRNFDMIIYAPEIQANALPNDNQIRDWIETVTKQEINRYRPPADSTKHKLSIPAVDVQQSASRANYHIRNLRRIGGAEYVLSNGIRVLLKPLQAAGLMSDKIMIHGFSPGGTLMYKGAKYASACSAGSIVSYCGVQGIDRCQLSDYLAHNGMNVTPYIHDREEGIMAYASKTDLESALHLVYLYFTSPKKDTTAYHDWLALKNERITKENASLKNNFLNEEALTSNSGQYASSRSIDETDLDEPFKIYTERFADASDFVFVITGNFEPKKIEPLVLKYLGSLPSLKRKEGRRNKTIAQCNRVINNFYYQGNKASASIKIVFTQPMRFTQRNILQASALGKVIELALRTRLREKEGQTYYVSVQAGFATERDLYSITIRFLCASEVISKMLAATMEELENISRLGPDPTSVQKAIQIIKDDYLRNLKDNQFWMNYLVQEYRHHKKSSEILKLPRLFRKLRASDIKRTSKQLLRKDNHSLFVSS